MASEDMIVFLLVFGQTWIKIVAGELDQPAGKITIYFSLTQNKTLMSIDDTLIMKNKAINQITDKIPLYC